MFRDGIHSEVSGWTDVRSFANTNASGVSFLSEAYLTTFYVLDFVLSQPIRANLAFAATAQGFGSITNGAVLASP